jgi:hypothetical protein
VAGPGGGFPAPRGGSTLAAGRGDTTAKAQAIGANNDGVGAAVMGKHLMAEQAAIFK